MTTLLRLRGKCYKLWDVEDQEISSLATILSSSPPSRLSEPSHPQIDQKHDQGGESYV
jgi:hypothetical protein